MASIDPGFGADDSLDKSANANGNGSNGNVAGVPATIDSRPSLVPTTPWNFGPPARPEILSAKPNPIELLHAVRRRWTLAIGLGVLASSIVLALLWFLIPVKYEAFALLKVAAKTPSVLDKNAGGDAEFLVFKRTQVQLILSGVVLQRTVSEPDIARLSLIKEHDDDPASWLKDQLIIDYPDDAEVLRVAMKGKRANEVIKIVDTIVDKYRTEIVQHDRDTRLGQERKLESHYTTYAQNCEEQLKRLHELEKQYKTSSTEAAQVKKKLALELLGNFMAERNKLIQQLKANQLNIVLVTERKEHPDDLRPSDALVELELNKDPTIADLTKQVHAWRDILVDKQSKSLKGENKQIRDVRLRIQKMEEQIEDRRASLRGTIIEAMAASASTGHSGNSGQLSLALLLKEKEHLLEQLKTAEDDVAKQANLVEGLESFNAAVLAKQQELSALQKITNDLRYEWDRAKIETQLAPDRVTKIDNAVLASGGGDAMRKYVGVAFGGILSFALVVIGVALVEFQARKVNSVHAVNDGLGIKVIGELPNVSGRAWRRMKGGKGPGLLKALMAERIDGTRTNLIHTTAIDPPKVVMITSAEAKEGKTTTATQLAASLARSGRRTLLIDGDIRNPGAHRVFEMPQEPGLCELLRGESDREAVIHPTRTANLWLMPAGRCDLRSVQALSNAQLGATIAALCVQFDYVIIDSGPVLKVADALMVGQHVDAAIMSVLRDSSKVPKVYEAAERLRSVGIVILGAVVNGVNDDVARHGVELLLAETPQKQPAATT